MAMFAFHSSAQESCAIEKKLRAAALDNFAGMRGPETTVKTTQKLDLKTFATTYLLPKASECTITLYDRGSSNYECEWHVAKGAGNSKEAWTIYATTVRSFLSCVPPDADIDESEEQDKRQADTSITFAPPGWPKGRQVTIDIEVRFHAPWWYVYVKYSPINP